MGGQIKSEDHKWTNNLTAETKNIPSNLNVDDSKLGVIIEKLEKKVLPKKDMKFNWGKCTTET